MTEQAYQLNSEGERQWMRLRRHLQWCDGFSLCFIFSDQPAIHNIFRRRFVGLYRLRDSQLRDFSVDKPADLSEQVLPDLLVNNARRSALKSLSWIDISYQHTAAWRSARLNFLARLNEQREKLRHALAFPLVLVLPADQRVQVKALIPDLWAIRGITVDLSEKLAVPLFSNKKTLAATATETTPAHTGRLTPRHQQAVLDEWQRVAQIKTDDRGVLLAGETAVRVCLETGQYERAAIIANQLVERCRQLLALLGETPGSLRDLSVSLEHMGGVYRSQGLWKEAQLVYEESLLIRRQLLKSLGETPGSLRDLSVSLDHMGSVYRSQGLWKEAQLVYEESLLIRRQLLKSLGETPGSLRDLSVSLDHMGSVYRSQGLWKEAQLVYKEAVHFSKILSDRFPEGHDHLSLHRHIVSQLEKQVGGDEYVQIEPPSEHC